MNNSIPLSVPNFIGNELKYVERAVESKWVSTGGVFIEQFEQKVKDFCKVSYAAACQSGTSALHLSLICLGVGRGDEVIVPALTFIAAVNPVRYVGAEPVFMDCDDSLCMDTAKLKEFCENECDYINGKLINKRSKAHVKAIIPVHVFGNLCDMEAIISIAAKFNIKVLEDATEALASYYLTGKYKGKYAGTIGDMGAYSFNANKIITTGGGGMIVGNDKNLVEHARYLSQQAKNDAVYFVHNEVGYNYRTTNIQAALGVAQMECLEDFIKIKHRNYDLYIASGIKLLPFRNDIFPNKWFYSYETKGAEERDGIIKYMEKNSVQTRPIWHLIHTLPPYKSNQNYKIEKAIYYQDRIVNIPCSSNLTEEQLKKVVELLIDYKSKLI